MTDRVTTNKRIDSRNDVVERIIEINETDEGRAFLGEAHELRRLTQAIRNRRGHFGIFFAVANDRETQERLTRQLISSLQDGPVIEIRLTGNEHSLLDTLKAVEPGLQPLAVYGIELLLPSSEDERRLRENTLTELQLRREQFSELNRPVVLWMPEYVYTLIGQKAVDFWSWQSGGFFFDSTRTEKRGFDHRSDRVSASRLHEVNIPAFVGRDREVLQLAQQLRAGKNINIVGMAGTGKTALAYQLAEQLENDFPDGQIFVSLADISGGRKSPIEGLRRVVQALEPIASIPEDIAQLTAVYRNLLSDKRALVILDDVDETSTIRHFLPPKSSCLVVTSRQSVSLPGIINYQLDVLSPAEANVLLSTIVPEIEPTTAQEISAECDFLPLAIVLAGRFLALHKLTPDKFLSELRERKGKMINSNSRSSSLSSVLRLSYENLGRESARVFRHLSVFPGAFDSEAEERICEDPNNVGMNRLREMGMLQDIEPNRYQLHPALRSIATALEGKERDSTYQRFSRHYLSVLWKASNLYNAGRDSARQGVHLFETEWLNIQAGQAWASSQVDDRMVGAPLCIDYPNAGAYLLFRRRPAATVIPWLESGLRAAQLLGNREFEQAHLGNLGNLFFAVGNTKKGIEQYEKALSLARVLCDREGEMLSLANMGNAYYSLGETSRSIQLFEKSLMIAREIKDRKSETETLSNLGAVFLRIGEFKRAEQLFEQALTAAQQTGDARSEAIQMLQLGEIWMRTGQSARAIDSYERAVAIARELGDSLLEGTIVGNLGRAYASLSDPQRAIPLYEQQLLIARQLGNREAEGIALDNLGNAYKDVGQVNRAARFHEEALKIARDLGNRLTESYALGNLGNLYHMMGHSRRALELYEEALASYREIGDRAHQAISLGSMGNAYSGLGDYKRALDLFQQELAIEREIGNRSGEAKTLGNMAVVYEALGDSARAIELYGQDLSIAREIGDRRGETTVLSNLGGIYAKRMEFNRALPLFEQALGIAREIGDRHGEASRLNNIANVHAANQGFEQALSIFEEALMISREISDNRLEGITLFNISQAYNELNRTSEARQAATESSRILESIEDPHLEKVQSFLASLQKQDR